MMEANMIQNEVRRVCDDPEQKVDARDAMGGVSSNISEVATKNAQKTPTTFLSR
jgi:hypothetical protein